MSRHVQTREYDDDLTYVKRRRSGGVFGWLLFVCALGGAAAFAWYVYLPLRAQRADLDRRVQEQSEKGRRDGQKLKETEERLAALTAKQQELSGQLEQTAAEKEKIQAELKRLQDDLSKKLETEILAGDVRIVRKGNDLVVDLADQILFDSGKADVNERGQKVLGQVAISLVLLDGYDIRVGGHTDSARITNAATQERFPTNWELSAARATNVVRFLQERGKIPGTRLAAVGFAEFRPAFTNETEKGRQKNRRIELMLQRR